MDIFPHNLNNLFEQLGLPSEDQQISQFIRDHKPLDGEIPLARAPFWNASQASFLHEALEDDSDWAEAADELNAMLRDNHH